MYTTTPDKSNEGIFALKMDDMFFVYTTSEKPESASNVLLLHYVGNI